VRQIWNWKMLGFHFPIGFQWISNWQSDSNWILIGNGFQLDSNWNMETAGRNLQYYLCLYSMSIRLPKQVLLYVDIYMHSFHCTVLRALMGWNSASLWSLNIKHTFFVEQDKKEYYSCLHKKERRVVCLLAGLKWYSLSMMVGPMNAYKSTAHVTVAWPM